MPDFDRGAPRAPATPLRLGSLNVVILLGRVTMDPDLKYTPKGSAVLEFRIAVNRRYKDKATDEWKDDSSFFNVNAWGQQAERLSETMKKGSAVLVEGQLKSRTWETQSGEKRYAVDIWAARVQVLDKTGGGEATPSARQAEDEPDIPKDQLDDIPF